MNSLIVVKKSILEDVQTSLIDAFNKVAEAPGFADKGTAMAELAGKILQYEEEISAKKGGTVNEPVLGGVQSKLLAEFNVLAASPAQTANSPHVLAELSDQIFKYEKKMGKRAADFDLPPGLK